MPAEARYTLTSSCISQGVLALTPRLCEVLGESGTVEVWVGETSYPLELADREVRGAAPLIAALGAGVNDTIRFVREGDRVSAELVRRRAKPASEEVRVEPPPSGERPPKKHPPEVPEWLKRLEGYGIRIVPAGEAGWSVYSGGHRPRRLAFVRAGDARAERLGEDPKVVEAIETVARVRPGLAGEAVRLALAGEEPSRIEGLLDEAHFASRSTLSAVLASLSEYREGSRFFLEDLELPPEQQAQALRSLEVLTELGLLQRLDGGEYLLLQDVGRFLGELEVYARELRRRLFDAEPPLTPSGLVEPPRREPVLEEVEDPRPSSGVLRVYPASERQKK